MSLKEEVNEILQEHELLCRTLALELPGEAIAGSLKEKLMKMADRAADINAKLPTLTMDTATIKALERVLQVRQVEEVKRPNEGR